MALSGVVLTCSACVVAPAPPPSGAAVSVPAEPGYGEQAYDAYPSVYPLAAPWVYGPPITGVMAFGYGWDGGWPHVWAGGLPHLRF